ncbi:hypothetical protein HOV93_14870 [Planctomycetes bacterium FF15]|uniref:Uncharacterized protein n=1 Tax=Bremerella alba TaxID=980252 RepID=A0A7V8V3Q4_9BACT|nr:hypothetical protein [Bremerella alba]
MKRSHVKSQREYVFADLISFTQGFCRLLDHWFDEMRMLSRITNRGIEFF